MEIDRRGSCGASLKHRARDAGAPADLRMLSPLARSLRAALVPRGAKVRRVRLRPRRPARPRTYPVCGETDGDPGSASANRGGPALALAYRIAVAGRASIRPPVGRGGKERGVEDVLHLRPCPERDGERGLVDPIVEPSAVDRAESVGLHFRGHEVVAD